MIQKKSLSLLALLSFCTLPALAQTTDSPTSFQIVVKDGKFTPAELTIPAGQKVKLTVKNDDAVQAEFESYKLDREQKIDSGTETEIFVGPLEAGEYPFFDDNNPDAKGIITAK